MYINRFNSSEIISLLKAISSGNTDFAKLFLNAWKGNKSDVFVRMLEKPTQHLRLPDYYLPSAARQFVLNVMINSKSKRFYWGPLFKSRCEQYLNNTSWRLTSKTFEDSTLKTVMTFDQDDKDLDKLSPFASPDRNRTYLPTQHSNPWSNDNYIDNDKNRNRMPTISSGHTFSSETSFNSFDNHSNSESDSDTDSDF